MRQKVILSASFISLLLICIISVPKHTYGLQIEGGFNYDFDDLNSFFSVDIFLLTLLNKQKQPELFWKGFMVHNSYEQQSFYTGILFGKAEIAGSTTQSIYIGPKIGINDYQRIGICLKGTTYISHILPFSLIIDPKYDFEQKQFIWDLKCSLGIGSLKPLDRIIKEGF